MVNRLPLSPNAWLGLVLINFIRTTRLKFRKLEDDSVIESQSGQFRRWWMEAGALG